MADFEKVLSIQLDSGDAERGLKKLDKGLDKVSKGAKVAKNNFKALETGLNKVSRRLAIVSASFAALGAVSIKNALSLNKAMANVSTLLDNGGKEVFKLKKGIQDLAVETGQSTESLADGLYEVVSALGDTSEKMGQLKIASTAAVAGRSSTLEAIKLLSAAAKGYGDTSAEAMTKFSDLAFMTVKAGQTTFPELAASMGKVIPLAAALKTEEEELFAAMATLTGITGDTSEVTTQLASVYSAFLKPREKLTELAKKYNFQSATEMLRNKGLSGTLDILRKATGGNVDEIAKLVVRKEAQLALTSLLGNQTDDYTRKLQLMREASGSTAEAFERQTKGINEAGHEFEIAKRRVEVFTQRIGDRLIPLLSKLLDRIEPLIKYIEDMSEETMDAWIAFGKWAAILAVATKSLASMLGIVNALGSLRSLTTGVDAASRSMGGLAANSANAVGNLSKLQKFGAIGAAAGAGFAIGSAINDIIVEPHARGRARREEQAAEAGYLATQRAKVDSIPELEKNLQKLKGIQSERKKTAGQVGAWEIAGGLAAAVGLADESPAQARKRTAEQLAQGIRDTELAIESQRFGQFLRGESEAYGQSRPESVARMAGRMKTRASGSGGGTVINNVTINESKSPKATGKEVGRILGVGIDSAGRSVGAPEQ